MAIFVVFSFASRQDNEIIFGQAFEKGWLEELKEPVH